MAASLCYDFLGHTVRNRLRCLHYVLWKCLRQSVSANYREDVHAGIIDMPQYLLDDALRLVMGVSVVKDLYNYLVSVYGTHVLALRDEDILQYPLVVRLHEAHRFVFSVYTYYFFVGMFKYLSDTPFRTMVSVTVSGDNDSDLITVKGLTDVILGYENVFLILVTIETDKTKTSLVCSEGANMSEILGAAVFAFLGNAYFSCSYQLVQNLLESNALSLWYTDKSGHFLCLHGLIDLVLYEIHDQLGKLFLLIIFHK